MLNKYSRRLTQVLTQGTSQAMLYGAGLREEDMDKPQIGKIGRASCRERV